MASLPEREFFALLDELFALGCTTFETAPGTYRAGMSETLLGAWMRTRRVADRVAIISKGGVTDAWRLKRQDVMDDLSGSLDRLGVDHVDLFLLHRDDPTVAVDEIVDMLHELVDRGFCRALGASNWTHQRIAKANAYAARCGLTPFAVSSPQFGLGVPRQPPWPGCVTIRGDGGRDARRWYTETRMPVLAWQILGGGFFTERYQRRDRSQVVDETDEAARVAAYLDELCEQTYDTPDNAQRYERAARLAAIKRVTVSQIALAYAMSQPMAMIPMVRCGSGDHYASLLAAIELRLTREELCWLEDGGPPPQRG